LQQHFFSWGLEWGIWNWGCWNVCFMNSFVICHAVVFL
jgi:hypothetical protein